ncbi:hypothetical protein GLAREA_01230 [Glarea lozoyensis ATCC 20868]|uniref:Uncharacterized protein n=1 Tax=Glarea lozoyensis (strain ATCC 20868 / MF5171) TaxID=1116229 RepID=S3DFA9_GLAL2|nr:uncharacterized protein GLAREA_01230 [Glarea lozoyensis ATCC 20868]EPE25318.1 hypothetical protein GLAREA_01230 [Glarea lozoyensis ATCC 20868]
MTLLRDERSLTLKVGKVGLFHTLAFGDEDIAGRTRLRLKCELQLSFFSRYCGFIWNHDDYQLDYLLDDKASGVVLRTNSSVDTVELKVADRVLALRSGLTPHGFPVRNLKTACQRIKAIGFAVAGVFKAVLSASLYSLVDVDVGRRQTCCNINTNLVLASDSSNGNRTRFLAAWSQVADNFEERVKTLTVAFIEEAAAVPGTSVENIQATRPLTAHSLASIIVMEFRKWSSDHVNWRYGFPCLASSMQLGMKARTKRLLHVRRT